MARKRRRLSSTKQNDKVCFEKEELRSMVIRAGNRCDDFGGAKKTGCRDGIQFIWKGELLWEFGKHGLHGRGRRR